MAARRCCDLCPDDQWLIELQFIISSRVLLRTCQLKWVMNELAVTTDSTTVIHGGHSFLNQVTSLIITKLMKSAFLLLLLYLLNPITTTLPTVTIIAPSFIIQSSFLYLSFQQRRPSLSITTQLQENLPLRQYAAQKG